MPFVFPGKIGLSSSVFLPSLQTLEIYRFTGGWTPFVFFW